MKLSKQIEDLIERLQQEGCREETLCLVQKIHEESLAWETRVVDLANGNLTLTDTLLSDRQLFEARLEFEKHCQRLRGNDHGDRA